MLTEVLDGRGLKVCSPPNPNCMTTEAPKNPDNDRLNPTWIKAPQFVFENPRRSPLDPYEARLEEHYQDMFHELEILRAVPGEPTAHFRLVSRHTAQSLERVVQQSSTTIPGSIMVLYRLEKVSTR